MLWLQDMLKQWICATTGKVLFTPKGRAFNRYAPSLGATANTAFLSLLYGQSNSRYITQAKSERYTCFARSQVSHSSELSFFGLFGPFCVLQLPHAWKCERMFMARG